MVGVFLAQDLFLFYVLWEFTLVPMYFLIGMWGGERRMYAAVKFFLYTMAGSVLMLLAVLWAWAGGRVVQLARIDRRREHPGGGPVLVVPGLRRRLCHQGADVAAAFVAARRPRRSAHRWLGDPGRRAAEDGHLRVPALHTPP